MAPLAPKWLLDSKPVSLTDEELVIGFDPEFSNSYESIRVGRNPTAVRHVMSEVLDREIGVRFELLESSETLPGDCKLLEDGRVEENGEIRHRTRNEWLQDPLLRKTLDLFDGVISDIRK